MSAALYEPLGIGGVVLGTVVSTAAMTVGQAYYLRRRVGGLELGTTLRTIGEGSRPPRCSAASPTASGTASTRLLGRLAAAQIVSVGAALALGSAVYAAIVLALRIPEAQQIRRPVHAAAAPP